MSRKIGINISLVIGFIFIFALCINEDNAGIVLKNFKSRRTMMEELEKETEDKMPFPSSTNITKNLIKSNKVKIKSKVKNQGSTRKFPLNDISSEVKNTSETVKDTKESLKDKNFPKLQNSSVVYVNDLSNRRERKLKSLANGEKTGNISDLSEPKNENNSLSAINSSLNHDILDTISLGNLNLSKINQTRGLVEELADKTKDEDKNTMMGNERISATSEKNNTENDTDRKSDLFVEKYAGSLIQSEATKDETFTAKNKVPDKFEGDSIKSQNFSSPHEVNISESTTFQLVSNHNHTNPNSIIGTVHKENQNISGDLDNSIQKLNNSKTNKFILQSKENSLKENSSVTEINSDLKFTENIQNGTVQKEFSNLSMADKTDMMYNNGIEVTNITSSTDEPFISDEFNVNKFMETLKEIVIDDIDQDIKFEPGTSGNSTQSESNSLIGSDISNNFTEVSQENTTVKNESLIPELIFIDPKLNQSKVRDTEDISKENDLESKKPGPKVETFITTFSNWTNKTSEPDPSSLDILMNSEVAKNTIDLFNISDSSLTDHVIEDSDFHSIIDLMLPSLPVLDEQILSKEKVQLASIDISNNTNLNETASKIKSTDSVEKRNESLIVPTDDTVPSLESPSSTANGTNDASKSKCPNPGICVFWFMARDACSNDNQCLGSKICCRIRCSKQCIDV